MKTYNSVCRAEIIMGFLNVFGQSVVREKCKIYGNCLIE